MTIKKRSRICSLSALLALLALASCAPSPQAAASIQAAPPTAAIECLVAYSARAGAGIDEERTLTLSAEAREQALDLGDLAFRAQYAPPAVAPGEHTFRLSVTARDTRQEVVAQLYQLPLSEPVRNQFSGDHGFTGLSYVHHPTSGAELQFTCKAR